MLLRFCSHMWKSSHWLHTSTCNCNEMHACLTSIAPISANSTLLAVQSHWTWRLHFFHSAVNESLHIWQQSTHVLLHCFVIPSLRIHCLDVSQTHPARVWKTRDSLSSHCWTEMSTSLVFIIFSTLQKPCAHPISSQMPTSDHDRLILAENMTPSVRDCQCHLDVVHCLDVNFHCSHCSAGISNPLFFFDVVVCLHCSFGFSNSVSDSLCIVTIARPAAQHGAVKGNSRLISLSTFLAIKFCLVRVWIQSTTLSVLSSSATLLQFRFARHCASSRSKAVSRSTRCHMLNPHNSLNMPAAVHTSL